MIICNSRKFTFIHLYKTGGSSFEIAVEPFLSWDDLLIGSTVFGEIVNTHFYKRFGLHKHSSLSSLMEIVGREHFAEHNLISLVRNPVKRATSLYMFIGGMIENYVTKSGHTLTELSCNYETIKRSWVESSGPGLEYYPLCWPASRAYIFSEGDPGQFFANKALDDEPAMNSQFSQLQLDGHLLKNLTCIKLEELDSSKNILKRLTGADLDIPHENKSLLSSASKRDVPRHVIDMLETRFCQDIVAFGY